MKLPAMLQMKDLLAAENCLNKTCATETPEVIQEIQNTSGASTQL